jgi:hypothetical protein
VEELKMVRRTITLQLLRRAPEEVVAVLAALSFAILDAYFLIAGHAIFNP